ncbi:MAG: thiamine diphosphokinase [Bacteroidales bacterium]|nr:thiamine diphosphokinase [Bacteroidales bacterium]MBQ1830844.1 thiamine diphosphokinase [Bacteroidales bacterium]
MKNKRIVILAAGDFPRAEAPMAALRGADLRICCDSAAEALVAHGLEPDRIVGDLDSLSRAFRERFADRITHISEQDDNDLTKAFHLALTLSPSRITILGATGKREDHTLGNISLLLDYAREADCPVDMLTDYGRFATIFDTTTLPSVPGQQISIFAFDNTLTIKSAGLKYPTDQVRFDTLWKATLNEALSSSFTLTLSHPSGVLLFFADHL